MIYSIIVLHFIITFVVIINFTFLHTGVIASLFIAVVLTSFTMAVSKIGLTSADC